MAFSLPAPWPQCHPAGFYAGARLWAEVGSRAFFGERAGRLLLVSLGTMDRQFSHPPVPRRIHGDVDARGMDVDFSVNVAAATPPWLVEHLRAGLDNLAAYPAPPHAAEAALAHYHGVPPECVRLLAGASEGFALLPALAGARPVVIHPGFSEPEDQLLAAGQEVTAVVAQPPFTHHALPDEASLVVLGNPCNPTGVVTSFDNYLGEHLLVVDEAFMDVVGEEHSAAHRAATDDQVLVLRSLTKTWAIAGLRVGYVIATPWRLEQLTRTRAHWPVGTLQAMAAEAIARRAGAELPAISAQLRANRATMRTRLERLGFQEAAPGHPAVPFLLVRTPWAADKAERIRLGLRGHGVAVRRCDTFRGLGYDYWRLAVRSPQVVDRLCAAVEKEEARDEGR